jgi:hypothetical protein
VITLGSTTQPPFLGYRGKGFDLGVAATASNATSTGSSTPVDPAPNADLSGDLSCHTNLSSSDPGVSDDDTLELVAEHVLVGGVSSGSGIGRMTLFVSLSKVAASRLATQPTPVLDSLVGGWEYDGCAETEEDWVFEFRTLQAGFAGVLSDTIDDRGPQTFYVTLALGDGVIPDDFFLRWVFTADQLNDAVALSSRDASSGGGGGGA